MRYLPVANTGVDHLKRGHNPLDRTDDVGHGDTRALESPLEDERGLDLNAGSDVSTDWDVPRLVLEHIVKEVTVIRLVDTDELLHHLRGQANLVSTQVRAQPGTSPYVR